ncbi:hypothetical protein BTO05_05740 [Winogradskyella sp. PC-19]|nr:hypothetical protein BTO05_05740 [Winogradskyella sp. PC-19]
MNINYNAHFILFKLLESSKNDLSRHESLYIIVKLRKKHTVLVTKVSIAINNYANVFGTKKWQRNLCFVAIYLIIIFSSYL